MAPACVQAIWPPSPVTQDVTCLAASAEGNCWTGGGSGSIVWWKQQGGRGQNIEDAHGAHQSLQPEVMLYGHNAPIAALLVTGDLSGRRLLSLDCDGGMCVWDCTTGTCVARQLLQALVGAHCVAMTDLGAGQVAVTVTPASASTSQPASQPSVSPAPCALAAYVVVLDWHSLQVMSISQLQPMQQLLQLQPLDTNGRTGSPRILASAIYQPISMHAFSAFSEPPRWALSATCDALLLATQLPSSPSPTPVSSADCSHHSQSMDMQSIHSASHDVSMGLSTSPVAAAQVLSASFSSDASTLALLLPDSCVFLELQPNGTPGMPPRYGLVVTVALASSTLLRDVDADHRDLRKIDPHSDTSHDLQLSSHHKTDTGMNESDINSRNGKQVRFHSSNRRGASVGTAHDGLTDHIASCSLQSVIGVLLLDASPMFQTPGQPQTMHGDVLPLMDNITRGPSTVIDSHLQSVSSQVPDMWQVNQLQVALWDEEGRFQMLQVSCHDGAVMQSQICSPLHGYGEDAVHLLCQRVSGSSSLFMSLSRQSNISASGKQQGDMPTAQTSISFSSSSRVAHSTADTQVAWVDVHQCSAHTGITGVVPLVKARATAETAVAGFGASSSVAVAHDQLQLAVCQGSLLSAWGYSHNNHATNRAALCTKQPCGPAVSQSSQPHDATFTNHATKRQRESMASVATPGTLDEENICKRSCTHAAAVAPCYLHSRLVHTDSSHDSNNSYCCSTSSLAVAHPTTAPPPCHAANHDASTSGLDSTPMADGNGARTDSANNQHASSSPGLPVQSSLVLCNPGSQPMLLHGYSSGCIHYCSAAAYAVPGVQADASQKHAVSGKSGTMEGHIGGVTCQVQVTYIPPAINTSSVQPLHLLITGGHDGSIRAWHMHDAKFGSCAFAAHVHTAAVREVLAPPKDAPFPYSSCVVSVGEDGTLALVDVGRGQVVVTCRGCPFSVPQHVTWSARRGYIACGGFSSAGQWLVALFCAHTGHLDRIVSGAKASVILEVCSAQLAAAHLPGTFQSASTPAPPNAAPLAQRQSLSADGQLSLASWYPRVVVARVPAAFTSATSQTHAHQSHTSHTHSTQGAASQTLSSQSASSQTLNSCSFQQLPSPHPAICLVSIDAQALACEVSQPSGSSDATHGKAQGARKSLEHGHMQNGYHNTTRDASLRLPSSVVGLASLALLHKWGLDVRTDESMWLSLQDADLADGLMRPYWHMPRDAKTQTENGERPREPDPAQSDSSVVKTSSAGSGTGNGLACLVQEAFISPCGACSLGLPRALTHPHVDSHSQHTVDAGPMHPSAAKCSDHASHMPQLGALSNHVQALPHPQHNQGDTESRPCSQDTQHGLSEHAEPQSDPKHHTLASAASNIQSSNNNSIPKQTHSATEPSSCASSVFGWLWTQSPQIVSQRLLALVALSRGLASQGGSRVLAKAASALWTLYLVQLREKLVPHGPVAPPDLTKFARLWHVPHHTLREAAQLLLSTYTDPTDPATGKPGAPPPQATALITLLQQLQPAGNSHVSQQLPGSYAQLQPLVGQFDQVVIAAAACLYHAAAVPRELIEAAASALLEVLCMPPPTVASAAGPQGCDPWPPAVCAALLASALSSTAAQSWRDALQPWATFLQRLFQLVYSIPFTPPSPDIHPAAATAEPPPISKRSSIDSLDLTQSAMQAANRRASRTGTAHGVMQSSATPSPVPGSSPSSSTHFLFVPWQSHLPASVVAPGGAINGNPPRPPAAAAAAPLWPGPAAASHAARQSDTAVGHTRVSTAPLSRSSSSASASSLPSTVSTATATLQPQQLHGTAAATSAPVPVRLSAATVIQMSDRLVSLLEAVMALDMAGSLHHLGQLLAKMGGLDGRSQAVHPLVLRALDGLVQTWNGWQQLALHAPSVIALLASALGSPQVADSRLLQQASVACIVHMARSLPVVACHSSSMQVAVSSPLPASDMQYVHVYDMLTGSLTWELPLQPSPDTLMSDTSSPNSPPVVDLKKMCKGGVTVLEFSPPGDRVAVYCSAVPCVQLFTLRAPWSQKLLPGPRQPLVLQPTCCWLLQPGKEDATGNSSSSTVSKAYGLAWPDASCVQLLHNRKVVTTLYLP